jgi:hypothetical protein
LSNIQWRCSHHNPLPHERPEQRPPSKCTRGKTRKTIFV